MTAEKTQYQTKVVTLDGNNNYIAVNVITKDKMRSLYPLKIHKDSDETYKFTNFEIAKFTAHKILDPSKKVEYIFHIGNNEFDMNDTQKIGSHYQYYDNDRGIKYFINDKKTYRVTKAGYICFEHGEEKFCDKEYGIKRQAELMNWLLEVIDRNIAANKAVGLLSREKISNREYVLKVKDSTARIHLLTNSRLMDWNQDRKEKGMICLPYNRGIDKFITFAVYVAKDIQERMYFDTDKKSFQIINDIVTDLRNDLPGTQLDEINPVWVETEFHGYFRINENKIH